MASFFQKSSDVERMKQIGVTKAQRFRLNKELQIVTLPFYKKTDDYGNNEGDICLPERALAEKLNLPWLSCWEASEMISILVGEPTQEEKEAIRQKLLSYCQGNPQRVKKTQQRGTKFAEIWSEVKQASIAAMEQVNDTDEQGIVAINVSPATVGMARWLKENTDLCEKSPTGGMLVTIPFGFNKAMAFAETAVNELRKRDTGFTSCKVFSHKLKAEQVAKLQRPVIRVNDTDKVTPSEVNRQATVA